MHLDISYNEKISEMGFAFFGKYIKKFNTLFVLKMNKCNIDDAKINAFIYSNIASFANPTNNTNASNNNTVNCNTN
jgi:hypothetical protein